MDTELMLDVGQANELKLAFRRSGYTNVDIKKLCEGNILARLLPLVRGESEFLKLISGNESLVLDAADGKEILADAKDIFAYIDSDLRNYGADEKGRRPKKHQCACTRWSKTPLSHKCSVRFRLTLEELCLTQASNKEICEKASQLVKD